MGKFLAILGKVAGIVDKVVPVAVGSRTKWLALAAALVPAVKGAFPEYGPLLDSLQSFAIAGAGVFGASGLLRK